MATIETRINSKGENSYRVRIRLHGYPKQTGTFDKLSDAKKWAAITEAAIIERRYFQSADLRRHTLAELITRYQKDILPHKSSNYTFLKSQHNQLEWWKQQLGHYLLDDVRPSLLVEARGKLKCSPSTANRYMAVLSHVFSIAVREWEWMQDSPIRKISKFREPRGRVRFLSEQERASLLAITSNQQKLYLLIVLALSTGARKGELLNLRWNEVDFERKKIIFLKTKNGERRSSPLGHHALTLLQAYSLQTQSSRVFESKYDQPWRADKAFKASLELAGIQDFRFHDLRHSAASYLAMNGASMTDIAEVLGHKTLAMVKRYTHLSESHTRQVVERMNNAIFQEVSYG